MHNVYMLVLSVVRQLVVVFCLLIPAGAAAQMTLANGTVVIGNDRGGVVKERLIELRNLRATGQPVEIRGNICYSTCTMLIGLPQTCVAPSTTFGFHGPSSYGRPLPPSEFDHVSRVMAHYYPEPIKTWFLQEGRNRINGVYHISGAELIRFGVSSCAG